MPSAPIPLLHPLLELEKKNSIEELEKKNLIEELK